MLSKRLILVSARWLAAAFLIYMAGTINFAILFSDYPAEWSEFTWMLYLLAWHALASFFIGMLIPVAWFLALTMLFGTWVGLSGFADPPAPFLIFILPVIVFGWLGSRTVAFCRRMAAARSAESVGGAE